MKVTLDNLKNTLKRLVNKLLGFIPTKTPVGAAEFEEWANSIIFTYQPAADDKSVKFVLSGMLMRLEQTEHKKSKYYFARCLHRAASGQVGAYVMEEIKNEQKRQMEAAQLERMKQVDRPVVAPTPEATTDGSQQT